MLDKLKSLFVVEEEVKASEKKETNTKATSLQKHQETADISSPLKPSGNVDVKIIEKLLQAVEKNNQEGFDYLEYKNALKALEKMPMDEATKYRSAFATASTIGASLENLVKSAQFYISVLDKENQTFLSSFKGQTKDKISAKEEDIVKFDNLIKSKSDQIKQLTLEIQKHQTDIAAIKSKLEESRRMMESTKANFESSYTMLKNQFDEDIVKMQNYLK
ncbi:hypothetical protein MHTCC0001_35020 [Flavobacteriaceae bacterium MHTCC 0001]